MKFWIMSKHEAGEFSSYDKYAIIGVVSHYDAQPRLQKGYVDALQLKFYDVDFETELFPAITTEDAVKIIEFVEKNKNRVEFFVVHCNAGVSRSSGITAALSLIYNGDDTWVFSNPKYRPNMLVYRKILTVAEKRGLLT